MIEFFRKLKFFSKLLVCFLVTPLLLTITFAVFYFLPSNQILIAGLSATTLIWMIFTVLYVRRASKKIDVIRETSQQLSLGKYLDQLTIAGDDELGAVTKNLNALSENLKIKNEFTSRLIAGDLNASYTTLNGHDRLGEALLGIKENLIRIKSDEQQRSWTSQALGKFVEILQGNKGLKELCNEIIINLVKTLRANQGAMFVAARDDQQKEYLNLEACYAYDRTKHLTKRIELGEGLVGEAYLEKRTLYLKKIPENYVRITSGLGDAPPTHLLIVPLRMNESVVGIIELAAFHEFAKHEIEFAEKIGESIAHNITSFRIAENTKHLLNEAEQRAEQMRAQEEELRQNQEELQATQEEVSRKYKALFSRIIELNNDSKFDQLLSITFARKRNIEYYFDIIRNQIVTFSEDRMVLFATKALRAGFASIEANVTEETLEMMRRDVHQYYDEEFIPRLNDNTGWASKASDYYPTQKKSIVLQYLYLSENPQPTGKKYLLDKADDSDYSKAHATYHPPIRSYLEKFGYYDIFILDPHTGDLVYSVFKEIDYATSLVSGLYSKTNFGKVVQEAMASTDKDFVKLIDFEMYDPSYGAPASFIARPIYEVDEKIGIVVFQMPINKVNTILTGDNHWREDGLGRTGETFIVGDDFRLRSITRGLIENPQHYLALLRNQGYEDNVLQRIGKTATNILLESVRLESVRSALNGQSGRLLERNTNGVKCLYTYAPLIIKDVNWAILSSLTEEEASERIENLKTT